MMIQRIIPIIKKEFRQIGRDKRSLGVLLVLPAFLVVLIGYALNFDVRNISVALFDQDRTAASRDFINALTNSGYYSVQYTVRSYREIDELLDRGAASMAIVIPPDFSEQLLRRAGDVRVQVIVDGSNANAATTIIGYTNAAVQNYSTRIASSMLAATGGQVYTPIDVRPAIWYNPELITSRFLVPGMIAFILMITGVVSTALSVVREIERGTMEQLAVSRARTSEIILGKTIPYLVVALGSSVLIASIGFALFGVAVKGSLIWLYIGIILFLLCAIGQGLFISTFAETQQVAFLVAVFSSLLPTFLLSGFVFPIRSMPIVLQIVSYIVPAKYFLVVIRDVVLKGASLEAFWEQLMFLLGFATLVLFVSARRLARRIA
jgi:ABC-2 type transport system permease protein